MTSLALLQKFTQFRTPHVTVFFRHPTRSCTRLRIKPHQYFPSAVFSRSKRLVVSSLLGFFFGKACSMPAASSSAHSSRYLGKKPWGIQSLGFPSRLPLYRNPATPDIALKTFHLFFHKFNPVYTAIGRVVVTPILSSFSLLRRRARLTKTGRAVRRLLLTFFQFFKKFLLKTFNFVKIFRFRHLRWPHGKKLVAWLPSWYTSNIYVSLSRRFWRVTRTYRPTKKSTNALIQSLKLNFGVYTYHFFKKKWLGRSSGTNSDWRRHKKRNIFVETYNNFGAVRRRLSELPTIGWRAASPIVHGNLFSRLAGTMSSQITQLYPNMNLWAFNTLQQVIGVSKLFINVYSSTWVRYFTTLHGITNSHVSKQAWQIKIIQPFITPFVNTTNLDVFQRTIRRISHFVRSTFLYPKKYKRQKRITAYRVYLRMRRAVLGISRRRYGYVNTNASRFSTGQYYWQHHIMRKRILPLLNLSVTQFKNLVQAKNRTTHCAASSGLTEQLMSTLPLLMYKYQMFSKLQIARFSSQICANIVNLSTSNCQPQSIALKSRPANNLLLLAPITYTSEPLSALNHPPAFGIIASSPELLIRKIRLRSKLRTLHQRIARCSWEKTSSNNEWYQQASVNQISAFTAGFMFNSATRFDNMYNRPYTLNQKITRFISRRTAS